MTTTIASIDGFPLDCTISESHSMRANITQYPTESGANIADHIRPLPLEVTIEGVVSDTPLASMKPFRADGSVPSRAAYDHLVKMFNARKPVNIVTSLKTYENMGVTSIDIPRARDKTGGLWFTVQFQQIEVIINNRVRRTDVPRAQGGGGGGKRGTGAGRPIDESKGRIFLWRKADPPGSWNLFPRNQWEYILMKTIDVSSPGKPRFGRRFFYRFVSPYDTTPLPPDSGADDSSGSTPVPGVSQGACMRDFWRDAAQRKRQKQLLDAEDAAREERLTAQDKRIREAAAREKARSDAVVQNLGEDLRNIRGGPPHIPKPVDTGKK